MPNRIQEVATRFKCSKCGHTGAHVEKVAHSGAGLSRALELQNYLYLMVSCVNCGFTETYNLKILEGVDNDQWGRILEYLTMD